MPLPVLRPSHRPRWIVVLLLPMALCGCEWFRHPSIDPMSFKEYQRHVVDIDTAEAISDPLERCMAYPNPPEFKWPSNLIRLGCEDMWRPVTPLSTIERMIDRQDWTGLDRHYAELVRRHHDGEDPEALLYRSFPLASWKSDADEETYTLKWLQGAPQSAYANMTRGQVLLNRAWREKERGDADGKPAAAMRVAAPLANQAAALLRTASTRDPRLMPAYRERLSAAMLTGNTEQMEAILEAAEAQSPSDYYVRDKFMEALEPEWFGSFDDMAAFAERVRPYVRKNPRLRILLARAEAWKGDHYLARGWYGNALDQYRKGLQFAPEESVLFTAANIAYREGHYAQSMMYWSQVIRFSRYQGEAALKHRAAAWTKLGDGTRGFCDYKTVVERDPSDKDAREYIRSSEADFRKRRIDFARLCGPGNMQATRLRKMLGLH